MDPKPTPAASGRRRWFAAAGTIGALAAVASVLPKPPVSAAAPQAPSPKPHKGGGYRVSEHIQRYYDTTRV